MNIVIRHEEEKDFYKVEELARESFYNLYFPGCEEHLVINKMRNHKDYIKNLSYILEIDGKIIGGIFYTKSRIIGKDNKIVETISFGPVFIKPGYQRQGFGKKLIEYSIKEAKKEGYRAILTLGYPHHYKPYGFLGGKNYNVSMEDGKFYVGLLVLPLYEDALKNISGYASFSDVFNISREELDEFDKNFPEKKKVVLESQKEFEIACSLTE